MLFVQKHQMSHYSEVVIDQFIDGMNTVRGIRKRTAGRKR